MKNIFLLFLILTFPSSGFSQVNVFDAASLFRLSVLAQNSHANAQIEIRIADGLDVESYKNDADTIKSELIKLNESNILEKKEFILLNFKDFDDRNGFGFLDTFAKIIGEKYGFFTAKEMIDFGISRYISSMKNEDPIKLEVFLPSNDMIEFEKYLKENELILK